MKSVSTENYFELLGVPAQYTVDIQILADNYRRLQAQVHPDRYTDRLEGEKKLAERNAALVNHAYQTLKDPVLRAHYLLEVKSQSNDDASASLPAEFLMEQMELRESLEESSDNADALEKLNKTIEMRYREFMNDLQNLFSQNNYANVRQTIQKMQFIRKLQEEIKQLQFNLGL